MEFNNLENESVNDIPNQPKYNRTLIVRIGLSVTIGNFLFGYDTGIVAGALLSISFNNQSVSYSDQETITSMAILGAIVGSLISGVMSDNIGRKKVIFITNFFFFIGSVVMGYSEDLFEIVLGRLLAGIGIGMASQVAGVYLSEITPNSIRGYMVSFSNSMIIIGQFFSVIFSYFVYPNWRLMLGFPAFISIVQLVLIIFLPESPKYLFKLGHQSDSSEYREQGLHILRNIYGQNGIKDMQYEISQIDKFLNDQPQLSYLNQSKELLDKYKRITMIGCCLQMFQQISGINTVMYYGPQIIRQSGLVNMNNKKDSLLAFLPFSIISLIAGAYNNFKIDEWGRRTLLINTVPICALGMLMMSIGVTFKSVLDMKEGTAMIILGITTYLFAFQIGPSGTVWTINSEIFPLHLRGLGNSFATSCNWIFNYLVSFLFLTLISTVVGEIMTYLALSIFNVLFYLFVRQFVIETKGQNIEDIVSQLVSDEKQQ